MTRWLGSYSVALAVLVCACDTKGGRPPVPTSPGDPNIVAVRVEGRVIDAETEESIPRATVMTMAFCYPERGCLSVDRPASATSDENGRFIVMVNIPQNWRELSFNVSGAGYEPARLGISPTSGTDMKLLRTLTIRPGESIDMRVFPSSYQCGWEEHLCRRVLVEPSTRGTVDLEVIPADSQRNVALFAGPVANHPEFVTSYPHRVTVSGGEVWIYADGAERIAQTSGELFIYDQKLTLIAHRD